MGDLIVKALSEMVATLVYVAFLAGCGVAFLIALAIWWLF